MKQKKFDFDTKTELKSTAWDEMSLSQLYEQQSLLNKRIMMCGDMKKPDMIMQITRSLETLQELIKDKQI